MRRERLRTLADLGLVVLLVIILVATLSPYGSAGAGGDLFVRLDSWAYSFGMAPVAVHFTLFALFGFTLALRYATSDLAQRAPGRALVMALLLIWLLGGATELAQGLTETREARVGDWVTDMLGGIFGLFVGSLALRWLLDRFEDA